MLRIAMVWVPRANGTHEILFMIRGRPRNGGDDVDVAIDVDDETRDEECSLLNKSLLVSRTFGQLGLNQMKSTKKKRTK